MAENTVQVILTKPLKLGPGVALGCRDPPVTLPGLSHLLLSWLSCMQKTEGMRRWQYKKPLLGKKNK